MKPQAQYGNQMRNPQMNPMGQMEGSPGNMDPAALQQLVANSRAQRDTMPVNDMQDRTGGMLGGMGNIQQLLQQRMGGMQRPGMPLPPSAQPRGFPGNYPMPGGGRFASQQPNIPPVMAGVDSAAGPAYEPPVPRNIPQMPDVAQLLQKANAQRDAFRAGGGGTIPAAMPAGKMQGGMNPYAQQLQQTRANPALQQSVTAKMRPTSQSDMSGKPPALRFSDPSLAGRMKATGPQNPAGARQRFQQNLASIKNQKPGSKVY